MDDIPLISFSTGDNFSVVVQSCKNSPSLRFKRHRQMIIAKTVSPVLKIGLQFFGIWPDVSHSAVHLYSFLLSMLIVQYFQYTYVMQHLKISELSNLIDGMVVTFDYSLSFCKIIGLWMHRKVFHKLLADMDNDWLVSTNIAEHSYMMTIKANISQFISNAIFTFNTIVGVLYFLGDYAIRFIIHTADYNNTSRQLPIRVQFPFDTQQSPLFEILVVTLFIHVMLHVSVISILNGLILTLVAHFSGQIDIICHEIKNISETVLLNEPTSSKLEEQVKRHKRIISFSENIEKLFSFIALMQVIWNTLVICCMGFIIIISVHNDTGVFVLVKAVLAYLVIMADSFVMCFAGEHLSLKSKLIANAIYETSWYDMPVHQSKIIIFVIMRSQRRMVITAGKMMDMSFETFTSIMKASASYMSVLNALY